MWRHALSLTVAVLLTALVSAQTTPSPLEGVWKITEIVSTGANATTNSNPQPSLIIFTKRHYSWVAVDSPEPRPGVQRAQTPGKLTDAEKIARFEQWAPFTAQSGTYEVQGTKLATRPTVAKVVPMMNPGTSITMEFKAEDRDTLWLIERSGGQPARETRTKLSRLE